MDPFNGIKRINYKKITFYFIIKIKDYYFKAFGSNDSSLNECPSRFESHGQVWHFHDKA